jgi:hypothetical protein
MSQNKFKEIAIKYRVDDLPGSMIPGGRLAKILEHLESSENSITDNSLMFLQKQGLLALFHYAKKEISYSEFLKQSQIELPKRLHAAEAKVANAKAEKEEKRKALAALSEATMLKDAERRRVYENHPRTIAKRKQTELKEKYGLGFFIEQEDYAKVMHIIRIVDGHLRLSENDIVWLTTEGEGYFTPELKRCYHKHEAEYHEKKYKKDKNTWSAVNASSHYRKCDLPENSLSLLDPINFSNIRDKHLKSAICTTKGGSMRDLGKFQEALKLATEAHSYDSKSFHPCTLLGAVNYEIGNFIEGDAWFQKAETRGASTGSLDHEIRSIYKRADKKKKENLRQHLLQIDPHRYSWVKK